MRKILTIAVSGILMTSGSAMAANFAVITNPPTLLNLVVLFVAVACLASSFKVLDILRGGFLFKSWQIFMFGFVTLAVGQVVILLNDFEIFQIPNFIVPALLVVTIGLFLYGIFQTKKTLS